MPGRGRVDHDEPVLALGDCPRELVSDLIGNTGRNIKHIPNSIFLVVGADPQRAKAMLGNVIVFESIDSVLRYLLRKLVASAPDAELDNRQASGNATME